jgi:hypothetical protein
MVYGLEDMRKINRAPRAHGVARAAPASASGLNWRTGNPKAHQSGVKGKPTPIRGFQKKYAAVIQSHENRRSK